MQRTQRRGELYCILHESLALRISEALHAAYFCLLVMSASVLWNWFKICVCACVHGFWCMLCVCVRVCVCERVCAHVCACMYVRLCACAIFVNVCFAGAGSLGRVKKEAHLNKISSVIIWRVIGVGQDRIPICTEYDHNFGDFPAKNTISVYTVYIYIYIHTHHLSYIYIQGCPVR
jgi:hypothetical protein